MSPRFPRLRPFAPVAFLLLSSCASRPIVVVSQGVDFGKIDRVAVLGFDDFPRRRGSGDLIASVFEKELLSAGYSVVERRRVDEVLKEQRLSVSGAVNPRLAKKLGQLLGVDAFLLGSVTSYRDSKTEHFTVQQEDVRRDPIVRHVTREKRDPDTGQVTTTEEDQIVGYDTTRSVQQIPQTRTVPAEVGVAARLVDVASGQVLWVGSYTDSGFAIDEAADDVAQAIMKAVKPTWPSSRAKPGGKQ